MSPRIHEHIRTFLSSRERLFAAWWKHLALVCGVGALVLIASVLFYAFAFGPAGTAKVHSEFIIAPEDSLVTVASRLQNEGLVKHAAAFRFIYSVTHKDLTLRPGGYVLTASMDALEVAKKLSEAPYLAWVSIPEAGLRKEEVADVLQKTLNWTLSERNEWLDAVHSVPSLTEGVFLPDTYLIPSDQPPSQVAARLVSRFEDTIAPYVRTAREQSMDMVYLITLASLVEREAAKNDKRLIAGILINRLKKDMMLQVDATLQYIEGSEDDWWPTPNPEDKDNDSPYNTYKHRGLPPGPIATPSLASIEAVLNPQETKCLYYLHDSRGRIHCSPTYAGHKANVNVYLR